MTKARTYDEFRLMKKNPVTGEWEPALSKPTKDILTAECALDYFRRTHKGEYYKLEHRVVTVTEWEEIE